MRVTISKANVARFFAAGGLALAFTTGIGWTGAAAADDEDNYFDRHPVPAGWQTGADPYDPYAPVDLGVSLDALRLTGIVLGADLSSQAEDPCSPMRCKAW